MFYILESIPVPPLLDFNNVKPSSLEVFKKITDCMEKRSQMVSAIAAVAKDERPPGLDPARFAEMLQLSLDMVR